MFWVGRLSPASQTSRLRPEEGGDVVLSPGRGVGELKANCSSWAPRPGRGQISGIIAVSKEDGWFRGRVRVSGRHVGMGERLGDSNGRG